MRWLRYFLLYVFKSFLRVFRLWIEVLKGAQIDHSSQKSVGRQNWIL